MLAAARVPVRVEGGAILAERATSGPWIFAPNHSSYLDILVILGFLPAEVRFVSKGEIRDMPFISTIAKRSGQFAFDRADPHARIRQADEVNAALKNGESVVIFPEGTFTQWREFAHSNWARSKPRWIRSGRFAPYQCAERGKSYAIRRSCRAGAT